MFKCVTIPILDYPNKSLVLLRRNRGESLKNPYELHQECMEEAFNVIRLITHETKEEQRIRYRNDNEYHMVIQHLINMYFTFKTDECLKKRQEEFKCIMAKLFDMG